MGGKQWKDRKHVLFYGAWLLVVLLMSVGCTTISILREERQGVKHLELAANMISKGDYDGALKEYVEVVTFFPNDSPGDKALFNIGIVWVHPDNPKKDYKKALNHFSRLLSDYPRSSLQGEARAWTVAIKMLISYENRIKNLKKTVTSYKQQIHSIKEKGIKIEEKKSYEDRIKDLEDTIISYKQQIHALKEIDIGIEEKKRKGLPAE